MSLVPRSLLVRFTLPLILATALAGCGGDDSGDGSGETNSSAKDGLVAQAQEILDCVEKGDLPGNLTEASDGTVAIDLTTQTETIIVYVLEAPEVAATRGNAADLDFVAVGNTQMIGGAITPEHQELIKGCLEESL